MKYRCPNCGHVFSGNLDKCPNCYQKFVYRSAEEKEKAPVEEIKVEEKVEAPAPKPEPKVEEVKKPVQQAPAKLQKRGESRFTGFTIGYIGWRILGAFVTLITLGIGYPIALAWIYKWEVNNTVVEGHRLRFDGVAGSLIPRWILWMLLTLIT